MTSCLQKSLVPCSVGENLENNMVIHTEFHKGKHVFSKKKKSELVNFKMMKFLSPKQPVKERNYKIFLYMHIKQI